MSIISISKELNELSLIQKEIDYINSQEFIDIFEDILFFNIYNKSFSNETCTLYFYTDYRDGIFDIISSSIKLNENVLCEFYLSNACKEIEDKVCNDFFYKNKEHNQFDLITFNNFIAKKYNLTSLINIDKYYTISELLDWNQEVIKRKILNARNNFCKEYQSKFLNKINSYKDNLKKRLNTVLDNYESKKNILLNQKTS